MREVVYLQFGFLLWLAAATRALCLVLTRRAERVAALLEVRRSLVAESTQAEERTNRDLAEDLHDGPLQTLLAARLEIDGVRERLPIPPWTWSTPRSTTGSGPALDGDRAASAGARAAGPHRGSENWCARRDPW